MPHLLQPAGDAALAAVLRRRPLLAFDFDGTLAPIVLRPERARMSESVAEKLRRLAARLPVAVVSGRSADDLAPRLAFQPHYVVGNHGAEMGSDDASHTPAALDAVRRTLQARATELQSLGIGIEDKGLSLALHYRLAQRPDAALRLIRETLAPVLAQCRTFAGKMVENVVPAGAPDKAEAMRRLVRACGASCAVFVGDDVNDEPVFEAAPDDWLTIRVGRDDHSSQARFFLDHSGEMALALDRMLFHLNAAEAPADSSRAG